MEIFGYQITKELLALYNAISFISGGLIGFFIKRWHIRYQLRQQAFMEACNKFREAFTSEIQMIQRIGRFSFPERDVIEILKKASVKHKEAYIEFRQHLNTKSRSTKLSCFDEAWIDFSCEDHEERHLPPYYNYRIATPEWHPTYQDYKNNALKRIQKLLEFAKN